MSSLRHKKMQFSGSAVFPLFIYLQNRQRPKFHFLLFPSSTELANTQFYLKEFADLRRCDLLACSWKQTVIIKGKSMGHSPLKTELTRHSAFPLKNFLWGFKGCYEPSSSINTLQCHGKPSKAHPDPHIGMAPHQGRQIALASKKQYNARQGPKVPQNLDLGQSAWINKHGLEQQTRGILHTENHQAYLPPTPPQEAQIGPQPSSLSHLSRERWKH